MNCSPPSSSVHGTSQARILEWAAISFSRGSSQSRDWTLISCIAGRFFTTELSGTPRRFQRRLYKHLWKIHGSSYFLSLTWLLKKMGFMLPTLFLTLWTVAHHTPLSMGSPGKNTGVGCYLLLQGIFLTQGLNQCLLQASCIGGRFFTTSQQMAVSKGRVKTIVL